MHMVKEQSRKIRNITRSKERKIKIITRRTKNQCLHTLTALADYTTRLPKTHGHYTVRNTKHATLASTTSQQTLPRTNSQISRLRGLLNSQPRPVHPCGQYHSWSAPQTTGTGGRTNATARKRVRPRPHCLYAAHLTQRKNTAVFQIQSATTPAADHRCDAARPNRRPTVHGATHRVVQKKSWQSDSHNLQHLHPSHSTLQNKT